MFRTLIASLSVFAIMGTAACATPPDLDLSLKHATADGKFVVTLQPPAPAPAINQMHSWGVRVSTPAGLPVSTARIAVGGGMGALVYLDRREPAPTPQPERFGQRAPGRRVLAPA